MCGLATKRISSGAPALTNSSSTLRREVARIADLAPELAVGEGAGAAFAELHVRLRVEDAAPPQAPGVAACARAPRLPRSRTIGRNPICARTSAAKMPHGPKPTTTGRGRAARRRSRPAPRRRSGSACRARRARADRRHARAAPRPRRRDLAVDGVDEDDRRFLRASWPRLKTVSGAAASVDAEARDDGARAGRRRLCSSGRRSSVMRSMAARGDADCRDCASHAYRGTRAARQWNASIVVAPISGSSRRASGRSARVARRDLVRVGEEARQVRAVRRLAVAMLQAGEDAEHLQVALQAHPLDGCARTRRSPRPPAARPGAPPPSSARPSRAPAPRPTR